MLYWIDEEGEYTEEEWKRVCHLLENYTYKLRPGWIVTERHDDTITKAKLVEVSLVKEHGQD